ncbi:MAG: pyruvate kinase, partial [Pyrinomonadaceae bacterium]
QDEHTETIQRVRAAAEQLKKPLAVLIDLSGPKIRTRTLEGGQPVFLETNAEFTITTRSISGNASIVSTTYVGLPQDVQPGTQLLLDDGAIELFVERTDGTDVTCRVVNGGLLGERKGINLPGITLPVPSLTEKDRVDLKWAVRQQAEYIALSFVRRAEDCTEAKELIAAEQAKSGVDDGRPIPLIAKIEKAEAIRNLREIVEAADGLMVARGDLGVETGVENVPVYQKRIIEEANAADKFVITATQMLQSMISSPRPTRAEASDVANAIWDGTDAVMLSSETATGAYPVLTVQTMVRIIETAEQNRESLLHSQAKWRGTRTENFRRALCEAAVSAAEEMRTVSTIAVYTASGQMARSLAALRPAQRIVALTPLKSVSNELSAIWGVESLILPECKTTEELVRTGEQALLNAGMATPGDLVVLMAGRLSGMGLSRSIKLHEIESKY